jgi:photosystem II stability/assembly factor-like uncharacterized protein
MRSVILLFILFASVVSVSAQGLWTARSTGDEPGDLVAVYFTSPNRGFAAGDKGYLASTNDGGKSWSKYPLNTTEDINEIYFRNDKDGYLVAGKLLFITNDGGKTWQLTRIFRLADFPKGTPEFLSIRFADKRRGMAVGSVLNKDGSVNDSLVMRTEDGGETWQRITVPTKKELMHLDYRGSSRVWAVGDDGVILYSGDGGTTWSTQNSGTSKTLYNVDFRNDDLGFAVGDAGTILRTENGGLRWEPVASAFTDTFLRVSFTDDKNGWIVGHGGAILRSGDKGKSWARQDSGTREHLYGLIMSKRFGWAVGAKGTILEFQK